VQSRSLNLGSSLTEEVRVTRRKRITGLLKRARSSARTRGRGAQIVVAAVVAAGGVSVPAIARASASSTTSSPAVSVQGNQLVTASGGPIRLLGVDRSGTEYACAQGWGIFDGPSDRASIAAIASWHVNAVRVPLNEDCWLGINGVNPAYSGANYQSAIRTYVASLNAAGLVAILDLHWSAPGTELALGQQQMADADHSPAFWSSVAATFRTDSGVVFDLYNEPHDISWDCWLNGCTTVSGWRTAGMQALLNAVRSVGAAQPVMAGGLNYAGDLSGWLAHEPVDPRHQLIASAHVYNFSQCNTPTCWDQTIVPVAASVPVITGELGENDCAAGFIASYMAWADAHGISYLGWSWNTAGCSSGPALITSYSGTPTNFGAGYQAHLAAVASEPSAGGAYVLDGFGNLDPSVTAGSPPLAAVVTSDSWPGWNIARSATALPDESGGYVLDGWGGVHPFSVGSNPMPPAATMSGYWPGWDIARSIAILPSGAGGYVLDGWGGVHPFSVGSNPMPPAVSTSAYWSYQDVARGIALNSAGHLGYVATTAGQVAPFGVGTAPPSPEAANAALPAGAQGRAVLVTS
jgi:endoglucanase